MTNSAKEVQKQSDKGEKKPKPSARRKARRFALQGLYQHEFSGTEAADIIKQFLSNNAMHKVDLPYFKELLRKIISKQSVIDENILRATNRPLDEINPVELAAIRIAAYELLERNEIPYKVIINEAVLLVKHFGSEEGFKYVNGVLNQLSKTLRSIERND